MSRARHPQNIHAIKNITSCPQVTLPRQKDRSANPPIYFLNNRLKEVQSLKLPSLAISHDLSWASHISELASKARCRLGIFHCAKSFLGTPELLSTYMAEIRSFMEYCSPLWAGSCASYCSMSTCNKGLRQNRRLVSQFTSRVP